MPPIKMELSRIVISDINDQQVIFLQEVDGVRTFPIVIGIFEATTINRRVKQIKTPRPLTHDLLVGVMLALGGKPQDVVINDLRDHTYFAQLRIRHGEELVAMDARPSDAIAIAVTCNPQLPIYIEEEVLNNALEQEEM